MSNYDPAGGPLARRLQETWWHCTAGNDPQRWESVAIEVQRLIDAAKMTPEERAAIAAARAVDRHEFDPGRGVPEGFIRDVNRLHDALSALRFSCQPKPRFRVVHRDPTSFIYDRDGNEIACAGVRENAERICELLNVAGSDGATI